MSTVSKPLPQTDRERVFDAFRRWGYLEADLDPLERSPRRPPHPELPSGAEAQEARGLYCGTIGAEFMHIPDPERRRWVQERMEAEAPQPDQERILDQLIRAELFEQVLQTRYIGTKRYSLEGECSLIPLLDQVLEGAAALGAEFAVLAMSHRGRLNVMMHTVGTAPEAIFSKFEDVDPRSVLGSGDVKYHLGATGRHTTRSGQSLRMHLVSNPSHLEAVDPVAMGRARAKQRRLGEDGERKLLPVVMHGDAAFAGQGIWAETLNFTGVPGFHVGGTVHIIVNNRIGFTTNPREAHSSPFSSDLAKRLPIPIFHVNAEDPEAVVRVGRMAVEYRYHFASDVLVDLVGYRRHGHSEVDDPSITQPILYRKIKDFPPTYANYAADLALDVAEKENAIRAELEEGQKTALAAKKRIPTFVLPEYWSRYNGGLYKPEYEVKTGIPAGELLQLAERLTTCPPDFHVHPKIKKLLEQRREMGEGKRPLDYGMAEALAFASLLRDGAPVRLSGQDSRRGTFNQRHSVLFDTEDEHEFVPLSQVADGQARFEVYNSILSEAAVLGFEYGYARDYPEALVLWEAQFGDFANGAQTIVDEFISAGEQKWAQRSSVVLLLPHGYEGQGPEHSSARIERYLQLSARDNMQVTQPSTAAQYFHLLRRQVMRAWRKPLVVFTPKSMLRHPAAASGLRELERDRFLNVIPDPEARDAGRLLVCTGKIGHELRAERRRRQDPRTAIIFLEQLYPFPESELSAALQAHPRAREVIWVQEEPANQGAHAYVMPRLRRLARPLAVRSVKRSPAASPATGSAKAHEMEQKTLLALAFAQ
ncbi:MAG TPA: 2-oxoglutarate dehydrogenase E1 component [Terriglobales bacterium]|nr:2-oxoglutarate dehydrogenase E1 component [Terriglobales bacterium]